MGRTHRVDGSEWIPSIGQLQRKYIHKHAHQAGRSRKGQAGFQLGELFPFLHSPTLCSRSQGFPHPDIPGSSGSLY